MTKMDADLGADYMEWFQPGLSISQDLTIYSNKIPRAI
jgi:hypothetical protein